MKYSNFFLLGLLLLTNIGLAQNTLPVLGKSPRKALLKTLTPAEKARLVVGTGMRMSDINSNNTAPTPPATGTNVTGNIQGANFATGESKVPGAAGILYEIPRVGIPSIVLADGPAGLRINPTRKSAPDQTFYCTAFPVATLIASTWNLELAGQIGTAMGEEAREYGVDVLLAPAMNIHRNPLAGRNFEYFSEDPLISGKMAAALVNGIQSKGVGTAVKHFAANNSETNRMNINTVVSERALREIYLKGFQIAIKESKPWTVMSSYNKINGVYTSESPDLLTQILRKEWGFDGLVMTDWFGGKIAPDQLKAGNDLIMPGTPKQIEAVENALKDGSLTGAALDLNVSRLLDLIEKTGTYQGRIASNKPALKAHAEVARNVASEGMILLKNQNNALPIRKETKLVAAFGNTSYDLISGGTGSGDVNEAYTISLEDGLRNAGFQLDEELKTTYQEYIRQAKAARPPKKSFFELEQPIIEMTLNKAVFTRKAETAEVAIVTIGRNAGEFQDRKLENDFYLSQQEKTLLQQVSTAFHAAGKKVIVIVNTGGVIEMASWQDQADAILLAWQGGQEAGNAIADVLIGKINPSGKLATTLPVDYPDVPGSDKFPGLPADKPTEITYEEGIYVGYRYFDAFKVKTAYPFGFGLSYTEFTYGPAKLSSDKLTKDLTCTVAITNTGKVAGKEVVQLYISAPSTGLEKPVKELRGFAKTRLLAPGETQEISFAIQAKDLCSFHTSSSAWIVEKGAYTVMIGASSQDIRQQASFEVKTNQIVEKVKPSLKPTQPIKELSRR
ncbi:MAG: glycoside hydrolase family 3 C-terminal domain-containing protein [Chitinophagales bacterium]|nr:glycoside hydrolase family 3 C-terminal domain-containing protein [Chitinophagales bacterium]